MASIDFCIGPRNLLLTCAIMGEEMTGSEIIAVVGLGYIGLPVAVGMARAHQRGSVLGFDVKVGRVEQLRRGEDQTRQFTSDELAKTEINYTSDPEDLKGSTLFIVTVPTPIDENRQPDLGPLKAACATVGGAMAKGALVVFESTVYPGTTEQVCEPMLAEVSGLKPGVDFALGYSPERINPGDGEHRLETIVKVIAASDEAALNRVEAAYRPVVKAGLHKAPSIRVAEAAKVIENIQRDINIALMNELALIFDRLNLRTKDVLIAAGTKWNFLSFTPGLVGGACISVDPYYLAAKADSVGYHPEVILAGRRTNDGMGAFIARKLIKLLLQSDVPLKYAKVGVLGLTFKENVPDLRNSRVPDILHELLEFGIKAQVHDPLADPQDVRAKYGFHLAPLDAFYELDALVLAVPHAAYLPEPGLEFTAMLAPRGILIDVKSVLAPAIVASSMTYWSL